MALTRREFLELATVLGAAAAWGNVFPAASEVPWRERRDLYPEGVASGDPDAHSVLLWTRRPPVGDSRAARLKAEVAEDPSFRRVIATAMAPISAQWDWTCRVLVGGLKPGREYYYHFSDESGFGSRVGRTITAPADDDSRAVRFAFVSCQNTNQGAQNAYRRMIHEDEKAPEAERLGFVLHLGDFIYEIVWYPEDRPQGMYDRRLRDIVRYAGGEKVDDYHLPTTLDDYRAVYQAYLHDPDIQDARARFPFVCMWDNHEFSWQGWQSLEWVGGKLRPAQKKKVMAMQAFWEYQPGRYSQPGGRRFERFGAPAVTNQPIERFDDHGFGQEPNNLAAVHSLQGYRALRWGRHLDLIVTDQRSYRSEDPTYRDGVEALTSQDFPQFFPEDALRILDAGRSYAPGAPATIPWGDTEVPNPSRTEPAQTILGAEQKRWFLARLRDSKATWKIWGSTIGTLDLRADPQNLPAGLTKPWPGRSYAGFGGGDFSGAFVERAEIYDLIRDKGITGFATVFGDRHSFWAGTASKGLPPLAFEPIGIALGTGSISAPGMVESLEHRFPKEHPLRSLFLGQGPADTQPQPTVNMLMRRGVKSCLEYAKSGDIGKARAATNPDLSPHLSFVDMGGHGYATVRVSATDLQAEFVCLPRPLERSEGSDGGPLAYRARFRSKLWGRGEGPKLDVEILEGDPRFSI